MIKDKNLLAEVDGEVAERLNAAVLKTAIRLMADREFESHPLRFLVFC